MSRLWGLDAGGEAWLRCPWWCSESDPQKVARNSIGRRFNKVGKRCNSNDLSSKLEAVVGELRAKLGVKAGREACGVGVWCPWVAAGSGQHVSTISPIVVEGAGGMEGLAAVSVGSLGSWPPEKSHVIRLNEVSTMSKNVAIPTV